MKRILKFLSFFWFIGGALPQLLIGQSVIVEGASGAIFEVAIDSNDRFLDVLDNLQSFLKLDLKQKDAENFGVESASNAYLSDFSSLNLVVSNGGMTARAAQPIGRDYFASLKKQEYDDVAYIVTKLAWDNPIDIWNKQSELEKAGERIAHIHPLNFLFIVFSSDKLIAGISAIKERRVPKLKSEFFKGLTDTLKEEANGNNLLQYVDDFAKRLGVSKNKITPFLEKGKYLEFVDCLIHLKPRENADRHDM